ncbi:CDP-alcohol phosphatidyltransferase family protein [Flavobacterium coralii]|uniref:CDP-alcohol phosphatidyltransferase family protein n=1 Tax=Flavobacterium coralii TaxID=2838017 RepID=UPI000C4E3322|nr:CDP-alcohol phosphatidyltransferase family protein [Flavobacterium coralii]MBF01534.1 phosphatidylserine synthase [Flavobacterium sp.]MBY8962438.1 CDP-alcohol phosphatidyltransferase family protein [Flavobacterium coralii]|tara:strand:+ start:49805 stop:50548 length:744 start_codon:yes stop_codon:yes gene_type:complete
MPLRKHVPNIITLLNLTAGLVALVYAFDTNLQMAFIWVCIGIFLDFWDGFFARILNAQSKIGLQLDSLADMVTSGVVPGVVMYKMLENIYELSETYAPDNFYMNLLPYIGFIITIGSCYRLAKFNVDTRQTDSFIGLPTPANALLIISLPVILNHSDGTGFVFDMLSNPYVLVGISLLSAFLLNAEIPLFSLKVKYFNWETNKIQIFFLVLSVLLLFFFQYLGIPLIILSYVILSVFNNKLSEKKAV